MLYVILILLIIFGGTFTYAGYKGAPWVPTWKKDVDRFIKLAGIKPGDKMYDLGCGDGRLVCAASKSGADAIGLEVSLFPYLLAQMHILFCKGKAKVLFKNMWKYDLSDADIVYFFISKEATVRLKEKFEKELKKGSKVISYVWEVDGWEPVKVDDIDGRVKIYMYEV